MTTGRKEHRRICKKQGRMEAVCCYGDISERPVISEKKKKKIVYRNNIGRENCARRAGLLRQKEMAGYG